MGWAGALAFCGPISYRLCATKHYSIDILAEDSIDNALPLQQGTLGFGLARGIVGCKAEQMDQSLSGCGGYGIATTGSLVSLEGRLFGTIEDENWFNGGSEESVQAVE